MYRLAQYRYLAIFVLLSFFMSFSITMAIPSATADESNGTTTVAASETFAETEIDYADAADEAAVQEAVAAEFTFQMVADPALGNPTLTVFFGTDAVSAGGTEVGTDASGNSIWQFVISYAADPMPEMSGARVDYLVVVPAEQAPLPEEPLLPDGTNSGEIITPPVAGGGYSGTDPSGTDPYDVIFSLTIINVTTTTATGFEAFNGLSDQDMPIGSDDFPDRGSSDGRVGAPADGIVYWIFEYELKPGAAGRGGSTPPALSTGIELIGNFAGNGAVSKTLASPGNEGFIVLPTNGEDSLQGITMKVNFNGPTPVMKLRLDRIVAKNSTGNILTIGKSYWNIGQGNKSAIPDILNFSIQKKVGSDWIEVDTASITRDECTWNGGWYEAQAVVPGLQSDVQYRVVETTPAGFTKISDPWNGEFKFHGSTHSKCVSFINTLDWCSQIITVNKAWTKDTQTMYPCNFILLYKGPNGTAWGNPQYKILPAGDTSLSFVVNQPGHYWVGEELNDPHFVLDNPGVFEPMSYGGKDYRGYTTDIGIGGGMLSSGGCPPPPTFINDEIPGGLIVHKVYDVPDNGTGKEATFELWAKDTVTSNEWLVESRITVGHDTTFSGLTPSSDALAYYLLETSDTDFYCQYHTKQPVTVPNDITVHNQKGRIIVVKEFSDGLDQTVRFHLWKGGVEIAADDTEYDSGDDRWQMIFAGLEAGDDYTLTEDVPADYSSNVNSDPLSVILGEDTTITITNTYIPPETPGGPGGNDENTPSTNTYVPPTVEVTPTPTEVTTTPTETTTTTTTTAVTPTPVEVVPAVTAEAPAETGLPKTGAESSAGVALLSMMFAGSGLILRKASYKI